MSLAVWSRRRGGSIFRAVWVHPVSPAGPAPRRYRLRLCGGCRSLAWCALVVGLDRPRPYALESLWSGVIAAAYPGNASHVKPREGDLLCMLPVISGMKRNCSDAGSDECLYICRHWGGGKVAATIRLPHNIKSQRSHQLSASLSPVLTIFDIR